MEQERNYETKTLITWLLGDENTYNDMMNIAKDAIVASLIWGVGGIFADKRRAVSLIIDHVKSYINDNKEKLEDLYNDMQDHSFDNVDYDDVGNTLFDIRDKQIPRFVMHDGTKD